MLCLPVLTMAQAITVPWQCGFEDAAENAQWVCNKNTQNANDQWKIGTATYSEGHQSLYISTNNGSSAQYGASPNVVIAYRTIRFPQKAGKYNISFDWKSIGDTICAKLYVGLFNEGNLTRGLYTDDKGVSHGLLDLVNESSGELTSKVLSKFMKLTDGTNKYDYLYGSKKWRNYSILGGPNNPECSISLGPSTAKSNYVLAFIWVNTNINKDSCRLGACIDNIQIASSLLPKPAELTAEMHCADSTITVSWQSTLSVFDIEYKNVNAAQWRRISNIPATDDAVQTYAIPMRYEEGSFNIRVRGYNGSGEASAYTSLNNVVYWCPDNHCINYIDLYGPNTECRTGGRDDAYKDMIPGVVDVGEEEKESRHTINWIEDRYDPITAGSRDATGKMVAPLKTIPDGYQASVRLGNWNDGSEGEAITYNFVVDSFSQAILILKYAIVFEQPGDQCPPNEFKIVVLDSIDREIDQFCGKANFLFKDAAEWNLNDTNPLKRGAQIYWKDWTTMGLDLRRYHGMDLKVRVSTKDCGGGGHFSYAYFVLDCVSASLETDNCGINSEIEVNAPEGFNYTWTDSKGNVKGHDRTLKADAGYEVYTCEVCMTEAADCCFELSTDLAPRYPAPQFSWKHAPKNCRSYVQFNSQSHVLVKYDDKEVHTKEACDQITWEFTNRLGTQTTPADNPLIECDPMGDTIYVSLKAVLGGGKCDSILLDTLFIPTIFSQDSIIVQDICEGEPVIFAGQQCDTTGLYYDRQFNFAGCDSLTILDLRVHPKSGTFYVTDTVCSSDLPYVLNGLSYVYSGIYSQTLYNRWNCDSVVQLSLQITEKLIVEVDTIPTLCADGKQLTIDYTTHHSRYDSLAIRFTTTTPQSVFYDQMIYDTLQTQVVYPYTDSILPNHYHVQLEFYQHHSCGHQIYDFDFDVRYRSSIVEQKWNDVLAILNSRYNGGYTFTAYQWYKDDKPLTGETGPYLYQPLDSTAEYSVELTRTDGIAVRSCAFHPSTRTDTQPFPTLAQKSQHLPVRRGNTDAPMVERVNIYTSLGQCYSSTPISDGEGTVTAPVFVGHYVVEFIKSDGSYATQHLIVY